MGNWEEMGKEKGERPGKTDLRSCCFFESQETVRAEYKISDLCSPLAGKFGLDFVLEPRLPGAQPQEIRMCSHHSLCVPKQKRREGGWPP